MLNGFVYAGQPQAGLHVHSSLISFTIQPYATLTCKTIQTSYLPETAVCTAWRSEHIRGACLPAGCCPVQRCATNTPGGQRTGSARYLYNPLSHLIPVRPFMYKHKTICIGIYRNMRADVTCFMFIHETSCGGARNLFHG